MTIRLTTLADAPKHEADMEVKRMGISVTKAASAQTTFKHTWTSVSEDSSQAEICSYIHRNNCVHQCKYNTTDETFVFGRIESRCMLVR